MSDKIAKLKAQQAEKLAEAEREEALRALLPIKPDDARIMLFQGRGHVSYKADTLADALSLLRAFDRVPFVQSRDTFLSHYPESWYKPGQLDKAKSTLDGCQVLLTIGGGKGFGPDATFKQWARLSNNEIVQVQVSVGVYPSGKGFPQAWWVMSNVSYDRGGNVIDATHRPPQIVGDTPLIKWGTGSKDSYSFSWLWMEQGTLDNEMARYLPKDTQEAVA